ncbi:hypothetical protein KIN20_033669, partial [Parelaphostrongylus tenuis]
MIRKGTDDFITSSVHPFIHHIVHRLAGMTSSSSMHEVRSIGSRTFHGSRETREIDDLNCSVETTGVGESAPAQRRP